MSFTIKYEEHDSNSDQVHGETDQHEGTLVTIEVDGVRHCHILDPRTGRSAQGFRSVTVQAPTCLVVGSPTTIAMLKGERDGLAWLESLGLPRYAILADGRVVDGFAGRDRGAW